MQHALPFRLDPATRSVALAAFNTRHEIVWFGFKGVFEEPWAATIQFRPTKPGMLGGGGTSAVNGGVIAAGFDAAMVLAGLGHYDTDVVVTLELAVQFLSLAHARDGLMFRAGVVRSTRHLAFVEAQLLGAAGPGAPLATARGMVAPRQPDAGAASRR
jgi:acyl-coenzyme A thioesterase PaaI-like protein